MQKIEQTSTLNSKEKEVLVQLPNTISRTFREHMELLIEPFSSPQGLNAKIKRVISKPQ